MPACDWLFLASPSNLHLPFGGYGWSHRVQYCCSSRFYSLSSEKVYSAVVAAAERIAYDYAVREIAPMLHMKKSGAQKLLWRAKVALHEKMEDGEQDD